MRCGFSLAGWFVVCAGAFGCSDTLEAGSRDHRIEQPRVPELLVPLGSALRAIALVPIVAVGRGLHRALTL